MKINYFKWILFIILVFVLSTIHFEDKSYTKHCISQFNELPFISKITILSEQSEIDRILQEEGKSVEVSIIKQNTSIPFTYYLPFYQFGQMKRVVKFSATIDGIYVGSGEITSIENFSRIALFPKINIDVDVDSKFIKEIDEEISKKIIDSNKKISLKKTQ